MIFLISICLQNNCLCIIAWKGDLPRTRASVLSLCKSSFYFCVCFVLRWERKRFCGSGSRLFKLCYYCVWSGCCFWSALLSLCLVWVLFLVNSVITVFGLVFVFGQLCHHCVCSGFCFWSALSSLCLVWLLSLQVLGAGVVNVFAGRGCEDRCCTSRLCGSGAWWSRGNGQRCFSLLPTS